MKIAIRMDDITPDMDWERFEEFKTLLDQYQVKPLLGIVPDNKDTNLACYHGEKENTFWKYMRKLQAEGWVLAMHGHCHIYTTKKGGCFPLNDFSEFAGLPYEEQKQKLEDGKKILEAHGIKTDIFMAPAHSYDKHTLRALRELGFTKVTDGFGSRPYSWEGIIFYPISFHMGRSLKRKNGFTTMVVHANGLQKDDMERYRSYLSQSGNTQWISYAEFLKQDVVRGTVFHRCMEYLAAKVKYLLVRSRH